MRHHLYNHAIRTKYYVQLADWYGKTYGPLSYAVDHDRKELRVSSRAHSEAARRKLKQITDRESRLRRMFNTPVPKVQVARGAQRPARKGACCPFCMRPM